MTTGHGQIVHQLNHLRKGSAVKTLQDLFYCLVLFVSITLIVTPLSALAEDSTQKVVFADLDGDGFHDSAEDSNNDGIPDAPAENEGGSPETSIMHATTINPFGDMSAVQVAPSRSTWKGSFGLRRIAALGLGASRCDFSAVSGDDDNPGNGGLGGGGACAGGVCIRR